MVRVIGAQPASARLQHLRWHDVLEVMADGANLDH
jgi:hypothetical protein